MDNLSSLLQEAKPVYLQRKYEHVRNVKYGCITVCLLLFIVPIITDVHGNRYNIESIYSDLYPESSYIQNSQSAYYIDEFDAMGVI